VGRVRREFPLIALYSCAYRDKWCCWCKGRFLALDPIKCGKTCLTAAEADLVAALRLDASAWLHRYALVATAAAAAAGEGGSSGLRRARGCPCSRSARGPGARVAPAWQRRGVGAAPGVLPPLWICARCGGRVRGPFDAAGDAFMALALRGGDGALHRGRVVYARAFGV
jgi:hypothetical protein